MIRRYKLISLALLSVLLIQPLCAADPRETKRALILYSEDKDHPGYEITDRAIRTVFRSNEHFDVQLYTEYLDASRFRDPSHTRAMADYLRRKYSKVEIHTLIAVYPYAVELLLNEGRSLFPGVPIIATEMLRDYAENLERSPARRFVTGNVMGDNVTALTDVALLLRPKTKRIALIAGTAPNDTYSEQIFRRGLEPYAGRIDLIDLTKLSMEETLSRVASLPPDTLVFYSSILRDGAGKAFVPSEALSLVARAATAPVFGLYEPYLGLGIVGGTLVSFEELGRESAALALRVMGGESPASIPFGGEQAYVSAYDWLQLERWGIDERDLPKGSAVINKPPDFIKIYKWYILGALLFIILETLLVIYLLFVLKKRKLAEAEAHRARTELLHVERSSRLGELVASLAHELNQPLTAILSSAQAALRFLQSATPDLHLFRTILQHIVEDDKRAAGVITSLRSLVKREVGKKESVNINEVLQDVLTLFRSEAITRNVEIETDFAGSLSSIRGDKVQLQQVMLNLFMNAAEAMSEVPHQRRTMLVRTRATDHGIQVAVRDFGPGIDPAKLEDIWQPFFTTKSTGLGMGLNISSSIIHSHGGRIWADNNPDGGATFAFEIPAIKDQ